jgi:hypothetical protein
MLNDGPLDELCEEKVRLAEKFKLVPKKINNRYYWVRQFGNRPDHSYATHRAFLRCSPLELVFSFYDLCVAKMTYFTRNINDYHCCKFNYRSQQLEFCPVWDMEFLVQKTTGIPVDLRNLAAITDINVFREMCSWLEMQQQEPERVVIPELFGNDFSYNFEASV